MKPTKNHTYCLSCRRPKMLFASAKEADAFIRFNAGEILEETGKAPVRSYYCSLCCGYHVTSNPSREEGESMDERDEGMIRQIDAAVKRRLEAPALAKNLSEPIAASIEKARLLMSELRLDEARALLLDVLYDIKIGQAEKPSWKGKGDELRLRAEKCLSLMDEYEAAGKDPGKAEEIRSSTSKSRNVALLKAMLANAARLEKLDGMIASIERSLEDGAPLEELLSMIEEAREKVRDWKNYGIKAAKAAYHTRLQELEKEVRTTVGAKARREKEQRRAILSAIRYVEKAAEFFPDGDPTLMWYYIDMAQEILSEVDDCPEKEQVISFLDRLTGRDEAD